MAFWKNTALPSDPIVKNGDDPYANDQRLQNTQPNPKIFESSIRAKDPTYIISFGRKVIGIKKKMQKKKYN